MAAILLNESDPARCHRQRRRLQRLGHTVWPAQHLNDIIITLHDVSIDLIVFDLDQQRLDDLISISGHWRGIKILFQGSSRAPLQDFRSWLADRFIYKFQNDEALAQAIAELLPRPSSRGRSSLPLSKSNAAQPAVA